MMPNAAESEPSEAVEAALAEYLRRLDTGEQVDRREFASRQPRIAEQLLACLEVVEQIERMAGPRSQPPAAGDTSLPGASQTLPDPPSPPRKRKPDPAPRKKEQLPRTFGRFEIQRQLGQGAMGAVYLAFDSRLQRKVALKFPKLALDAHPDLRDRFYREARAAATLRHPNICPVYDADCIDGVHFIAMAFIEGRPLSEFIDPFSPPVPRNAALVIRKIALAVHEAHKQGIIHRDLKPSNIVVDHRHEPIVMDFGLARLQGQDRPNAPTGSGEGSSVTELSRGRSSARPVTCRPNRPGGPWMNSVRPATSSASASFSTNCSPAGFRFKEPVSRRSCTRS